MRMYRTIAVAGLVLAGAAAVTGCAPTSPAAAPAPPAASTTTAAPPPAGPTAAAPTTPAPVVTRSFDDAKAQWTAGATAISAEEGRYWDKAADDLTLGETTDSDPTGYADAVTQLRELVGLPDAQQTAEQNARYHADIDALNVFFHTPGLYS